MLFHYFGLLRDTSAAPTASVNDAVIPAAVAVKPPVIIERIIANARYSVTNRYTRKTSAESKRRIAYAQYTVGYSNIPEARAIIECVIANACHAIRDSYAFKARTTRERRIANDSYTSVVGYNTVFTTRYQRSACRFNKTV